MKKMVTCCDIILNKRRFKENRNSFQDRTCVGCSDSSPLIKVHDMMLKDRRLKLREFLNTSGMLNERVGYICSRNCI